MTIAIGIVLTATTLIARETALGLVFDPRRRNFSFASLTMSILSLFVRGSSRRVHIGLPMAEAVFAGLLGLSAIYVAFNEGFENRQSLWTCAVYFFLSATLARGQRFGPNLSRCMCYPLPCKRRPLTQMRGAWVDDDAG